MRILLIEDDQDIAEIIKDLLNTYSYAVDVEFDGVAGLALAETFPYDLLIVDITLPGIDGISICQKLRRGGCQAPILILTGRNTSTDKALGLNIGADDYVVKPFDQAEFMARIQALLRRGQINNQPVLERAGVCLDPNQHLVTYQSQPLSLTPKEYGILELFLRNVDWVFSLGMIIDHVWSAEDIPGDEAVRVHIKGLRKKLRAAGAPHDFIETLYGVGYRLKGVPVSPVATTTDTPSDRKQRSHRLGKLVTASADPNSGAERSTQILLVSAQPKQFTTLKPKLALQGWDVQVVARSQDFWSRLQTEPPHALVLDMQMIVDHPVPSQQQEMSAIATCQYLRAQSQWQHLPIVMILPDLDPAHVHEILSIGIDDFVLQPIAHTELIARLQLRLAQTQTTVAQPIAFPGAPPEQMQNQLFRPHAI